MARKTEKTIHSSVNSNKRYRENVIINQSKRWAANEVIERRRTYANNSNKNVSLNEIGREDSKTKK